MKFYNNFEFLRSKIVDFRAKIRRGRQGKKRVFESIRDKVSKYL